MTDIPDVGLDTLRLELEHSDLLSQLDDLNRRYQPMTRQELWAKMFPNDPMSASVLLDADPPTHTPEPQGT